MMRVLPCMFLGVMASSLRPHVVRGMSRNNVLRFLFRRMTPDSKWPPTNDTSLKIEHCKFYNESIKFPNYYLKDFHPYDGGNLNPVAAKEASSATSAVMQHHFGHLSGTECSHFVRSVFSLTTRIKNVHASQDSGVQKVVDFGCGIGVSTRYIRNHFENDEIIGIDLSPFYLQEAEGVNSSFVHGNIEATGIESGTVDVVCISYVFHELPCDVSLRVLREASRILKQGTGVISILDMHRPKSSSPLMKYIFDRTEPYLNDYGEFLEVAESSMESSGFGEIDVFRKIPKTITIFARKTGP